jgi:hypothetical protein
MNIRNVGSQKDRAISVNPINSGENIEPGSKNKSQNEKRLFANYWR